MNSDCMVVFFRFILCSNKNLFMPHDNSPMCPAVQSGVVLVYELPFQSGCRYIGQVPCYVNKHLSEHNGMHSEQWCAIEVGLPLARMWKLRCRAVRSRTAFERKIDVKNCRLKVDIFVF